MARWRWSSLLLAIVAALGTATLVGAAPAGPAAGQNAVVLFTQQEPSCLQPLPDSCQMFVAELIRSLIFADVISMSNEWKYFPVLAEKLPTLKDGDWKVLPNNKMQVTWRLRRGYTWHDGKPVTAQDWIWAWRVNLHPEFPTAGRDVAERVENIQAPNPYTMVVQWKKKYAFANLSVAGSNIMPKHATERLFRQNPSKFDQAWGTSVPTIGNGPYVLKEWQKGSSMTVEAYPNWKGAGNVLPAQPAVKRVTYRFISDTNTIIANVLSGAADGVDETAIPFVQGLELEQRLAREGRRDFVLRPEPGLVWEHIDLNLDNVHLRDKRVRQALIFAINRDELVKQLFEGKQAVSHSFLPEKHYGYHKNVKKYPFNPDQARRLLAEAGYTPGSDGILQKGGQRLSLTFMTTAGNRTRESVQQILQTQWKAVGVDVRISNQPARTYFGDTLPTRKFELAMYAWVFSPTSDCEGLYTGDTIPSAERREGQNYPGYKNDEVTRICHAVPEELDEGKRAEMLRRAQEIWVEDLPVIPLYLRSDYTGHKASLQNWKPTGSNTPLTWNATQWRWTAR
jgi:peptide/nickel transport system substrate-binding protein